MAEVVRTKAELREFRRSLTGRVGLVPTMGALHEGHRALLRAARERSEALAVSIFVNPLQFGPGEDLDRYPRSFDADLAMCEAEDAALVFAPTVEEMYAAGRPSVSVVAGDLGARFEGASRPGHFDGVLMVVTKLLNLVQPDLAVFGEKDAQQLALVRRLVRDLDIPVDVHGVSTVREPDGLALSSRNAYLTGEQRQSALALSRALRAAVAAAAAGGVGAGLAAGRSVLDAEMGVDVDYFAAVDDDFVPVAEAGSRGTVRLVVAARVGSTRLIDNATATG